MKNPVFNTPVPLQCNTVFVDVMKDDRFLFTVKHKWPACHTFNIEDVQRKVLEMRPSLKGKSIHLCLN